MSQVLFNGGGIVPPSSGIETLTGNTGGAVGPSGGGNVNIVGNGTTVTVAGNAGTNTLTISLGGTIPFQFDADTGSAVPSAGVIHMDGGTNINSVGAGSVVTFNLDDAITLATSVTTPLLLAPAAGNLIIRMGDSIGATAVIFQNSSSTALGYVDSLGNAAFNSMTAPLIVKPLTDADSPYTVQLGDQYMSCDVSGGALTIRLPNSAVTGYVHYVKDSGGDAATNNITITTVGGAVLIDGATSFVMATNYQSVNLLFNGASWEIW